MPDFSIMTNQIDFFILHLVILGVAAGLTGIWVIWTATALIIESIQDRKFRAWAAENDCDWKG